jgi:hypothetical protein
MKLTKEELAEKIWNYQPTNKDYVIPYRMCAADIVDIVMQSEIIQPSEVDTELEEAKKRFPAGSWFTCDYRKHAIFQVEKIQRDHNGDVDIFAGSLKMNVEDCTPFTFPTALQWKSVSEPPDDNRNVLLRDCEGYMMAHYTAFYRWAVWNGEKWVSQHKSHTDAQWTELPK